ncbi:cupin domain-containing protein [Halobacteriovorax sp. RT-2-4]|uniref:cupin domain-containing protein n=1 Tax=unclassified Halobacteriovorax TaxID=2639665 RepID=UPI0039997A1C
MKIIDSVKDVNFKTFPGGDMFSVLVGRHDSTGASEHHTVAIVKLPAGTKSDEHYHKEREESYFVISGTGRAIIDGVEKHIKAGSLVYTKPNEKHAFINDGNDEFIYLIITAPYWVPEDSHH